MSLAYLYRAIVSALCFVSAIFASYSGFAQQYSAQHSYRMPQQTQGATPEHVAQSPTHMPRHSGPSGMSNHYVPRHLRTASTSSVVPDGGAYRVAQAGPALTGEHSVVQGGEYIYSDGDEFVGGEMIGNYFEGGSAACDQQCPPINDCRDCLIDEDCWANGLGGLLYNSEYFFGAHGFTSPGTFTINRGPQDDASFGLHAGFNMGLPLRKLTCGLVSGQLGGRVVHSNFNGSPFTSDRREQNFVTAGFFRRVDSGLQFGVVADVLNEKWFAEINAVQMRGDLSWAWLGGHQFGFRFVRGVQDDSDSSVPGFGDVNATVYDNYRFYYQHAHQCGGYSEVHVGWSNDNHTIVGMDHDLPINYCWSLLSSVTYLIPDSEQINGFGNSEEGWNISVSAVYRPRALNWYRWYHRPLLPVADNGSMIIRRALN